MPTRLYLFVRDERGGVDLSKIDLGGNEETFGGRVLGERAPSQAHRRNSHQGLGRQL